MTYSLAVKGAPASSLPNAVQNLTTDDSVSQTPGDVANAMSLNTQFLCKKPDGSSAYYTYDAERSTPGNPVLKAVGP